MPQFLSSPWAPISVIATVVTVLIAVFVLLFKTGRWSGKVEADHTGLQRSLDDHKNTLSSFMAEIRDDIKQILTRLPPATVAGASPLTLTDLGKSVSQAIGGSTWAELAAITLAERAQGKQPQEIQELCFTYVTKEYTPDDAMDARIMTAAYENGIEREQILRVLAIELRDRLLGREGHTAPSI